MEYSSGSEDDTPCRLELMKFIMHLPTDYYKNNDYLMPPQEEEDGEVIYEEFVWALRNAGEGLY